MTRKEKLVPSDRQERIEVLDALRGFAIFGIFIINIRVLSGYSYISEDMKSGLWWAHLNPLFDWIHIVFFSGKFYTLFSFLFGIGFAVQIMRASKAERNFIPFFSRRLFFLLIIGLVHLWGIWFSDILVLYAICGYFLIFFKGFSNRALIISFLILLITFGLHDLYLHVKEGGYTRHLYTFLSELWNEAGIPKASGKMSTFQMADISQVIREGSLKEVLKFNNLGPILRAYIISYDARFGKVLGIFILGFWTGRKIINDKIHENKPFLLKVAIVGWLIGLPLNILYNNQDFSGNDTPYLVFLEGVAVPFGNVCLSSAYAATFGLLYLSKCGKTLKLFFSAVGKTALSNYILQSVIGIALFYSIGLGLSIYFGSALLTIAVFVIFILQVLLSNFWFNYFRFGPLEWIWRVLTYGKFMKNLR